MCPPHPVKTCAEIPTAGAGIAADLDLSALQGNVRIEMVAEGMRVELTDRGQAPRSGSIQRSTRASGSAIRLASPDIPAAKRTK